MIWGHAAIGCRPDAADAERDQLLPARSLVINYRFCSFIYNSCPCGWALMLKCTLCLNWHQP